MRAHLQGIADKLSPLGVPVHLFRADGPQEGTTPPVPYLVAGGGWTPGEESLCGPGDSLRTSVVITCVDDRPVNADHLQRRVRGFFPVGEWVRVTVAGRVAYVKCTGATQAEADPDVRLPSGNQHPGVGHVLLDLNSEPDPSYTPPDESSSSSGSSSSS